MVKKHVCSLRHLTQSLNLDRDSNNDIDITNACKN